MEMGERIKQKRQEKGLSMQGLADLLHVGRSAVNKWEKGHVQNIKRRIEPSKFRAFQALFESCVRLVNLT